jgi:hypothetical protein
LARTELSEAQHRTTARENIRPYFSSLHVHFDLLLSINFLPFLPPPALLIYSPRARQYEEKATAYFRYTKTREENSYGIIYRILCVCEGGYIACILFISGSFNDAVSRSDYIAKYDKIMNKYKRILMEAVVD